MVVEEHSAACVDDQGRLVCVCGAGETLCSRPGCDEPSIGRRSYNPGAPLREVCAEHDAAGRASVAAYEADFRKQYGQHRSPWS